ncbi:toxin VasX [Vibrio sp. WXL103]|uniref:toxin VasX n=1 Tax=Vibrio sp. WXL103 TaxID=3450710 RepID=UPI003EC66057
MAQEKKRYPFPDEHSVYWTNPDLTATYAEAVEMFEAQSERDKKLMKNPMSGQISAETKAHLSSSSHPFPGENSMYWSNPLVEMTHEEAVAAFDAQSPADQALKRNPVTTERPSFNEVLSDSADEQVPAEVEYQAIVPVRYAFDITGEAIPAKAPFRRGRFSTNLPYTLRQLRDGFVYVFDEHERELHEYVVEGSVLKGEGVEQGYLEYPKQHKLKIAFSAYQWTDNQKFLMASSASQRGKWMRQVREGSKTHVCPTDSLGTLISDIEQAPEHQFLHTISPLEGESSEYIQVKPLTQSSDWLSGSEAAESSVIVALEDPIADLYDLTMALEETNLEVMELIDGESDETHQWQMAQITRQVSRVTLPEGETPPAVTDHNYMEFERALDEYLRDHYLSQQAIGGAKGSQIHDHAALDEAKAFEQRTEQKLVQLKNEWGYTPKPAHHKQWAEKRRLNQSVRWGDLHRFSEEMEQKLAAMTKRACDRAEVLRKAVNDTGKDLMLLGLDNQDATHQEHYQTLMSMITLNLLQADQYEPEKKGMLSLLKADNLLSLVLFGGSTDLKVAVESESSGHSVFDNIESAKDIVGNINNFQTLADTREIIETEWYKKLSQPVKSVMAAMKTAVSTSNEAWGSLITHLTSKQLPSDSLLASQVYLRSIFVENFLFENGHGARFDPDYPNKIKAFYSRMDDALDAVNKAKTPTNAATSIPFIQDALLESAEAQLRQAQAAFPALMKYRVQETQRVSGEVMLETSRNLAKKASDSFSNTYNKMGGTGGFVAILNAFNFLIANESYHSAIKDSEEHKEAQKDLYSAALWTATAISEVAYAQSIKTVKALAESDREKTMSRLMGQKSHLKPTLERFAKGTLTISIFGLAASALDASRLWAKLDKTDSEIELLLSYIQLFAHGANLGAYGTPTTLLALESAAAKLPPKIRTKINFRITTIAAPWMVTTLFAAGAVILITSALLSYLERSEMEKWLQASTWGNGDEDKKLNAEKELSVYLHLVNQPQARATVEQYLPSTDGIRDSYGLAASLRDRMVVTLSIPPEVSQLKLSSPSIEQETLYQQCRWDGDLLRIQLDDISAKEYEFHLDMTQKESLQYIIKTNGNNIKVTPFDEELPATELSIVRPQ